MSDTTAKLSRRRFLKTAAGASALVALPHFIPGFRARKRRHAAAQRADRRGRHRHRQPGQL